MNTTEAAALLSVAAAFDNRKPDANAAEAWARALDGLRFEDCRDAIVRHYADSNEWLMPGTVKTLVKRIRAKRIDEHAPLLPPPGLDDEAERRWLANARWRVGNGETVDCDHGELVTGPEIKFGELLPRPEGGAAPEATA